MNEVITQFTPSEILKKIGESVKKIIPGNFIVCNKNKQNKL